MRVVCLHSLPPPNAIEAAQPVAVSMAGILDGMRLPLSLYELCATCTCQQEMELRFLYGRDTHVDYAAIDADVDGQLDAHWAKEAGRDAEDAYFGDTDDEDAGAGQQDGTARSGADEEHSMDYDY